MELENNNLDSVIQWIRHVTETCSVCQKSHLNYSYKFYANVSLFEGKETDVYVSVKLDKILDQLYNRKEYLRMNGSAGHKVKIKVIENSVYFG